MNRLFLFFLLIITCFSAQEKKTDTLIVNQNQEIQSLDDELFNNDVLAEIEEINKKTSFKKLNPTRAGLYSAVLPGLGQYYNRKYWKIPIVWAAVGTGVGVTLWYDKQYKRYRKAYVAELNGLPHEFSDKDYITAEVLGNTQDQVKRQRDYAIAITGLVYILNIIDAVVDAHLYEGCNDPDLALKPTVIYNEYGQSVVMPGLSLNLKF